MIDARADGVTRLSHINTQCTIFGVDFTSAPSRRKAITVAVGALQGRRLTVVRVDRLTDFPAFENFLQSPGPWVAGFDMPFGLPRELVTTLGWPTDWARLVAHTQGIGKDAFKLALNTIRESRPYGARYIHRSGDSAAGSSSPMKLINPPVGLMFYEGTQRLLAAQLSVIPCMPTASERIALETYPGYLARRITRASYKKDGKEGATAERREARGQILARLCSANESTKLIGDLELDVSETLREQCIDDGSGDTLDAVLCAVQSA
ncbi:MAG TPA: DUF429 domain-containing protein, partial [Casimicrobium sp.]|nr:DUF429 domain-containing protein [Casimicrobium sp.]